MTIKTLTITLLLSATLLLFTGCEDKHKGGNPFEGLSIPETSVPVGETGNSDASSPNTDGGSTVTDGEAGSPTTSGSTSTNNDTIGSEENNDNTGSSGTDENTNTSGGNGDDTTPTPTPTLTLSSLKLTIDKITLNKDENTTVKVMATYSDDSTKDVTDNIAWISSIPDTIKVTSHTLTALQDKQTILQAKLGSTLSEKITLDIYWEVNGYRLPPEPDPTLNDATLLGVDSNDNDVRDDIERKVYATYPKAIQRAVMMQAFRAEQKMLADPDMMDNARVWEKEITKFIDCGEYLYFYKKQIRMKRKDAELTSEWQFNNKERVKIYIDYNKALSGGVYDMNDPYLQACEFDVEKVMKMDK